ncbi:hypothetical protein FACS1894142_3080 [Spirochaetia bacterium]|nr:hypothetical protein FACS1894142_3080 [Spirochaetia bacterium]
MNKQKYSDVLFFTGLYIFSFVFITIVISNIFFIVGISISIFNTISSVILSYLLLYSFEKDKKKLFLITCLSLGCIIAFMLFSMLYYDNSFDGNVYHKEMVGVLKNGWNPVYKSYQEFVTVAGLTPFREGEVWYDSYGKSSEIFGACIYKITGNIEAGKCYTFLLMVTAALIITGLINDIIKKKYILVLIPTIFLSCNVMTINQSLTYYNDAFLGLVLFISVAAMVYLTINHTGTFSRVSWLILFMSLGLGITIKVSGLLHFASFAVFFYVLWIVRYCKGYCREKLFHPARLTSFFIGSVLFGLLIIGVSTYVSNTIRYHNPLYPVFSITSISNNTNDDAVSMMVSGEFEGFSHAKRFFYSLFSELFHTDVVSSVQLKIPFTVHVSELRPAMAYDIKLSGWGIWESGIVILGLILLVIEIIILCRQKKNNVIAMVSTIFVSIILSIFVVPGLFMARYFLQVYIIPYMAIILLLGSNINKKGIILFFWTFLSFGNILMSLGGLGYRLYQSQQNRVILQELKGKDVKFSFYIIYNSENAGAYAYGFKYTLIDAGIDCSKIYDRLDDNSNSMFWEYVQYEILD